MRVAITGGTGFFGGHLAVALAERGHAAVVVARGVDRRPWALEVERTPGVTVTRAGIQDEEALARAFEGCQAVAHCAGINRELGAATYEAVHVQGTANVVRAAERAGARRLVLVSFLRARPNCGSAYHESKWVAEEIVRSSRLGWTVLKPSMMFGRGDHMLDHLSKALRTFPVYIGVGPRMVRPLAVQDAVTVLLAALLDGRLSEATVPLLGPTVIGFDAAARLVAGVIGKRPLFLRAPIFFHYLVAASAERLMTIPLISTAQVRILEEELIEPTLASDAVPDDLAPSTRFDEASIRAGLSDESRFGLRDIRLSRSSRPHRLLCGEGNIVINRAPNDILEFVLDVERYRRADFKIGPVRSFHREGETGWVRHDGRFLGIRAPAVTLSFKLTPYSRLDFAGVDMPWPLKGFSGLFTCEETQAGTHVVHRECFEVGSLLGPLLKPSFGRWLSRDTRAEVLRMKRILEADQPESTADHP